MNNNIFRNTVENLERKTSSAIEKGYEEADPVGFLVTRITGKGHGGGAYSAGYIDNEDQRTAMRVGVNMGHVAR
jgi:hypothetical protein